MLHHMSIPGTQNQTQKQKHLPFDSNDEHHHYQPAPQTEYDRSNAGVEPVVPMFLLRAHPQLSATEHRAF